MRELKLWDMKNNRISVAEEKKPLTTNNVLIRIKSTLKNDNKGRNFL